MDIKISNMLIKRTTTANKNKCLKGVRIRCKQVAFYSNKNFLLTIFTTFVNFEPWLRD
jgi:hypothetical protein